VEEVARVWGGSTRAQPTAEVRLDIEAAWRLYYASMVSLATLLCGSRRDAEDIVQDVFVSLHRARDGVHDVESYLRAAVVNRCRSRHRRELLARRRAQLGPETSLDPDTDVTLRQLRNLKPKQRTALVLRFYHDLSMAQVALAMGCSTATARSHVHRGLKALREVLEC
jgi:RNA polymerase sigma factor (sigma-70 family)